MRSRRDGSTARNSGQGEDNVADYSCNVTIVNGTPYDLTLVASGITSGKWTTDPPASIAAFQTSPQFTLADKAGAFGSEGFVQYGALPPGSGTFEVRFYDPADNHANSCSISNPGTDRYSVCFVAATNVETLNNRCPPNGHPLTMTFYIRTCV
jgi:hypothetical protein